jgi:hypothetical protein
VCWHTSYVTTFARELTPIYGPTDAARTSYPTLAGLSSSTTELRLNGAALGLVTAAVYCVWAV